jgi:hypothetical protein
VRSVQLHELNMVSLSPLILHANDGVSSSDLLRSVKPIIFREKSGYSKIRGSRPVWSHSV